MLYCVDCLFSSLNHKIHKTFELNEAVNKACKSSHKVYYEPQELAFIIQIKIQAEIINYSID